MQSTSHAILPAPQLCSISNLTLKSYVLFSRRGNLHRIVDFIYMVYYFFHSPVLYNFSNIHIIRSISTCRILSWVSGLGFWLCLWCVSCSLNYVTTVAIHSSKCYRHKLYYRRSHCLLIKVILSICIKSHELIQSMHPISFMNFFIYFAPLQLWSSDRFAVRNAFVSLGRLLHNWIRSSLKVLSMKHLCM